MNRFSLLALVLLVAGVVFFSGCSLCCSPHTDDYVTYGSRTPRLDMKHGRVGSILSEQTSMSSHSDMRSDDGIEYDMEFEDEVVVEDDSISLGTDR